MAFGLSFGSKKQKNTQDTTLNRTETGTQSGTSNTNATTNTSSSATTQGSSNTSSNQATTQAGTSSSQGTSNTNQQQVTKNFSDPTLGGLEGAVQSLLGQSSLGQIQPISNFDREGFVANGMRAAEARTQTSLDEALGGIVDAVGGRNNSAAALLSQRVNNDATAQLAGTQAQLTAQAEEIARNNLLAGNQVAGQQNDLLTSLLGVLRGGISTTSGSTQSSEEQSGRTSQTGTQTGSESTNTSQTSQTRQTEQLIQTLAQLLNTTNNTVGTESVRSTGRNSGFGAGLSL